MTQSQKIYLELHDKIIFGVLQPGQMLGEQELASAYDTSKMPVREALHHLVRDGYLISHARRGYEVSNVTQEDLEQLLEFRTPLELLSVELAVVKATDDELRGLYDVLNEEQPQGTAVNSVHRDYLVNGRFHLALARLSGNRHLYEALEHVVEEMLRAGFRFYPEEALTEQRYHRQLVSALLLRDKALAKSCLLRDLHVKEKP